MLSINFLSKIKNNFAIIYAGNDPTIATKLILLQNNVLKKYPDINIWYTFRQSIQKIFPQFQTVITLEKYLECENNFLKFCEINANLKADPVLEFCEQNDLEMFVSKANNIKPNKFGLILNDDNINIQELKNKFACGIVPSADLSRFLNFYDAFIGFESVELLACAAEGKKIYLLKKGLGHFSFPKMFPDTELLELN